MVEINVPEGENEDIYSKGFDKSLNREIDTNASPTAFDSFEDRIAGQNISLGGLIAGTGGTMIALDPTEGLWLGAAKFDDAPFRVNMAGELRASSATISGAISGVSLDIPDAVTANSFHVDSSGNMWLGATTFAAAPAKISNAGAGTFSSMTITGGSVVTSVLSGTVALANTDLSATGWNQTCAFSVTDADTVAWGAGTFRTAKGTSYSIGAGNTDNPGGMVSKTYIYLDIAVSTTAYQKTTTQTTAVGASKVLVAVAQNGTTEARYMLFNDNQQNIDAANIVAGTVTANEIAASTITGTNILTMNIAGKNATFDTGTVGGWELASNKLSSITGAGGIVMNATASAITLGANVEQAGYINAGAATAPLTGNGFYLGWDQATYGFDLRAGDPAATYMHWDDSANTLNIVGGSLNVGTTGNVRGGATDYLTGTGFFLGYSGAAHKFSVGNPSGNYIAWNGSAFVVNGFALTTQLPSITTFSASGTWTKPSGLAYAVVKAWGGGGSGGQGNLASSHGASGGGGGCYMERTFTAAQLGATETVTVGAGGAGVTNNNNGNVGGNTTFGTLLTAYGGGGGAACSNDVNDYPVSGGESGTPFAAGQTGATNGTSSSETTPIMGVYGIRVVGAVGASGYLGAAGGGATLSSSSAGGNALKGGAGGGAADDSGNTTAAGGTSIEGGNGGAGSITGNGTAGSARGGGGGACAFSGGTSGAGGAGYVEVWQFFS